MQEPTQQDWLKAGQVARETLEYGASLIKKGALLKDVAIACDQKMIDMGAVPAFPAQISCNEIAAHFCPDITDEQLFEDQVVSLDVGACVNGAIGDNAQTIDLSGEYKELVQASRDALNQALKIVQIGTPLGEIGKAIQETIQSYGYSPVRNLSGHGLGVWSVHEKPNIPNIDTQDKKELKQGMYIAIEPFASTGAGEIYETGESTIFSLQHKRPVRNPFARDVLKQIETYKGLPFAKRWLSEKQSPAKVNLALRELERLGIVRGYPPLVDIKKGIVSQAEHSVYVDEKPIITTKSNE